MGTYSMNSLLSTPTICYMSNGWITDQAEPQAIKIAILPFSLAIQGTKCLFYLPAHHLFSQLFDCTEKLSFNDRQTTREGKTAKLKKDA